MNDYPSQEQIEQSARVLKRLPRGFLSLDIFEAIAEKVVLPCLELSILRQDGNLIEVLLTKRPPNDHYWPNAWHLPGGALLATDKEGEYTSIFERILQKELGGEQKLLYEPQFVVTRFQETKRGRELTMEYFSEVAHSDETPTEGDFFQVNALPDGILTQYREIIPAAVEAFKKYSSRTA